MANSFLNLETFKENADFCFVGINCCSAEYLKGVEYAAEHVRKLSLRYANADGTAFPLKVYNPQDGYILQDVSACDIGDINAPFIDLEKVLEQMSFIKGAIPIFVGGDHAITYPLLKRLTTETDVIVLQFDSHSDYIAEYKNYPHGSVMNEVNKLEKVEKIIHIGLRGNLNSKPAIKQSLKDGNVVIPYSLLKEEHKEWLKEIQGKKIYISFDIDFLNPSIAPATNCPEPGGPTYEETLECLKQVISSAEEVVGMDFVEYNPMCEGQVLTGITLVNLIMQCIYYIKSQKTRREALKC